MHGLTRTHLAEYSLNTHTIAKISNPEQNETIRQQTTKRHNRKMALMCAIFAVLLQISPFTLAADSTTEMPEKPLDEIIVTAERFDQSAQDIAASISVFVNTDLEKSDLISLQDIDRHIPNTLLSSQGSPRFTINSIRGISSAVRDDYFGQTLGIYIDGVPATAAEYSRALTDVERIEVLRGPQGTLYGRNTPGGIVNIITKPATDKFRSEFTGRAGNNGRQGASALLSGRLIEGVLAGKLFVDYSTQDGFTDYASSHSSIDDLETLSGSAALRYQASKHTDVMINLSAENIKQGAYAFQGFNNYKNRNLDITPPNREDREVRSATLNINHDMGNLSLQSISGLRRYEVNSDQDLNYNPLIVQFGGGRSNSTEEGDQFSQEIRLFGISRDNTFRWLVGSFYSEDTVDFNYLFSVPAFGPASLSSSLYDRKEIAIFGEATKTVMGSLDLTAGVRTSKDKHDLNNNYGVDDDIDFTIVTPKLRATYRFDEDAQVYVLAARGSRTGGFNRFSSGDSFKPEYLWNYELGLKSQWLDNKLILNAALFYIDWENQQIKTLIGPGSSKITNAGESQNKGAELEFSWQANTAFYIAGFLGVNSGEYEAFINTAGQDLFGNELVNTPNISTGLVAEYSFPLFAGWANGWIRPEFSYTGDHYFDPDNRLLQKGYALFNLNAGFDNERFSASIFVKNLFDKDYRSYAYTDNINNYDLAIAGEFRTFGLKFKVKL